MAKKKQPTADDILKMMYPDLPTSEDEVGQQQPQQQPQGGDDKAQIAALQAQIAALEGRISQTSKANVALQTQATTAMPPTRPNIDYTKAPDPVEDKDGYTRFMLDAQRKEIEYEKSLLTYQQQQAQQTQQKSGQLWSSFSGKYGDYAKDEERLTIATQQVIQRARASGLDTERYMYANADQFMEDVTKEFDKLFGKPGGKQQEVDDEEEDDDDGLTTSLIGGGVGGGGGRKQQPAPQRYGELSQEINAWQQKTGFHR